MSKDTTPPADREIQAQISASSGFRVLATPEARASALAARKANAEWARANLKSDFLDDPHWMALARERGLRLPAWTAICTRAGMVRWLHRLGVSLDWYRDQNGYRTPQQWIKANPTWPLRAFVGLCLEGLEGGAE